MPSLSEALMKHVVFAVLSVLTLNATSASAVTYYFAGSLSADQQNQVYKKSDAKSGSASIEVGLADTVRVGITHEEMVQSVKGYDQNSDRSFTPVDDYTRVSANSLDVTLIVYKGDVFAPFIKGGFVAKDYRFKTIEEASIDATNPLGDRDFVYSDQTTTLPTWQAGVGLAVNLNRQFSLRFAYMVSPGIQMKPGQDVNEKQDVLDRKSTVGLSYQLQ